MKTGLLVSWMINLIFGWRIFLMSFPNPPAYHVLTIFGTIGFAVFAFLCIIKELEG